jgi:hypothetical protein
MSTNISVSKAPSPAEGKVEMMVSGCPALSHHRPAKAGLMNMFYFTQKKWRIAGTVLSRIFRSPSAHH